MLALALVAPISWLCLLRGGVDPQVSAATFGVVLAAAAILCAYGRRPGVDVSFPWPVAALAVLPVLQLVPLGEARTLLWLPWRQDLSRFFTELGVEAPSSISIHPEATLRSTVMLAGCCALFALARAVAQRRSRDAVVLAAVLLAVAAGEAVVGLWQALGGASLLGAAAEATSQARGTFANRNHFAVLLEAGFCLALGLFALSRTSDESVAAGKTGSHLSVLGCATAGGLCVAGLIASGSRMGITVACVAAVVGSKLLFRDKGMRLLPFTLAALFLVAVLSLPQNANGFTKLLREKGDPGRMAIWSDSLPAATRYLPAGSGLGTFTFAFRRSEPYLPRNTIYHAHCDWLEFLVELGPPGALLLAASIGCAFSYSLRRRKGAGAGPRHLIAGFLLATGAILTHSTVDFPLQIPALAALFCVMLGSAVGLASHSVPLGGHRPSSRLVSALGCGSFAVAAAMVASGAPKSWDAQSLYERGMRHFFAGDPNEAELLFRQSLAANPYAALVWQKRAEVAQMRREDDKADTFFHLASELEPFTFRTEWPAAQAALRRQLWEEASQRLRRLAEALPDVRPAVFRAALKAGMPTASIAAGIVPQDAAGLWLRLLTDREAWLDFERSLAQWNGSSIHASPGDLRCVFDRLFQRSQQRLMKELWLKARPDGISEPFLMRPTSPAALAEAVVPLPGIRFANQDDASVRRSAELFASGFGFQWVSHPQRGVHLRVRQTQTGAPYIELDIRGITLRESVHLSHYFLVSPATQYSLQAQIRAENPAGGEVHLEVWSASRPLGRSLPARLSGPRRMEVPFRTDSTEHVLQLRVVSSRVTSRKEIRGRFLLGDFQLRVVQRNAPATTALIMQNAGS